MENAIVGNMFIVGALVFIITMIGMNKYQDFKIGKLKEELAEKMAALKAEYEAAVAKIKR
jgi:hypothetical protein